MATGETGAGTINRVFAILDAFSETQATLSLSEISRRIGLPKSTAYRLLTALERKGALSRDPDAKTYRLGYYLIRLGRLAQSSIGLRSLALPVLRRLSQQTGETAVLSVLDRENLAGLWVEQIESPQAMRWSYRLGHPLNLHAGASSKVLWAFLPEEEIDIILGRIDLAPLMPNTITDRLRMREELRAIRARGYAVSFEETDSGAMGIAAPVYDHEDRPAAGIGIIGLAARVKAEQVPVMARAVLEASCELSKLLGASGDPPRYDKGGD